MQMPIFKIPSIKFQTAFEILLFLEHTSLVAAASLLMLDRYVHVLLNLVLAEKWKFLVTQNQIRAGCAFAM